MSTSQEVPNHKRSFCERVASRFGLVVALVFLIPIVILYYWDNAGRIIDRFPVIDVEMQSIHAAVEKYRSELGAYPGRENKAIAAALRGNNASHTVFLNVGPNFISPAGELLDAWGTPYRFYFANDEMLIRSAGPNKRFDSSAEKDFDDKIR